MAFRGDLLRAWRESQNPPLSQEDAAKIVNVSQAFWGAMETGKRSPSTGLLVELSHTTGISTDNLLGNPTESPSRRGRAKDTQAA